VGDRRTDRQTDRQARCVMRLTGRPQNNELTRGRVRGAQLPARTRTDTLTRDRRQTRLITNQPASQSDSTQLKAGNYPATECFLQCMKLQGWIRPWLQRFYCLDVKMTPRGPFLYSSSAPPTPTPSALYKYRKIRTPFATALRRDAQIKEKQTG